MSVTELGRPLTLDARRTLPAGWRRVRLKDILVLRKDVVHPRDSPKGKAVFVGLEHIQSGTGIRLGAKPVEMADLSGRKPRFFRDDIVYGYLRPYLNKVWVAEFDGLCSVDQYVYHVRPDLADTAYVAWFMRSPLFLRDAPIDQTPGQLPRIRIEEVGSVALDLPPLDVQRQMAGLIRDQMSAVERAQSATAAQRDLTNNLVESYLTRSLRDGMANRMVLSDCLIEVTQGIGDGWRNYRLVGATRGGLAPAKDEIGKAPERYKPVKLGTVFYNPMRILIGSIAMIDDGDEPGITSPDYVVFRTRNGILHARWFYFWLRSRFGEAFIRSLARGAVRERLIFSRLSSAHLEVPDWGTQQRVASELISVTNLERRLDEQLTLVESTPKALLARAFPGDA